MQIGPFKECISNLPMIQSVEEDLLPVAKVNK
jgi:hypothetical protein